MEKGRDFGDTVKNWKHYADGKKTIVYCASIKSSKGTAAAFQAAGSRLNTWTDKRPLPCGKRLLKIFERGVSWYCATWIYSERVSTFPIVKPCVYCDPRNP